MTSLKVEPGCRWAWVAPWGWTWIDAAPWGFAPFHYGSWVRFGVQWAWSPGPRGHHARFAPVLGGWIGGPSAGGWVQFGGHRRPAPFLDYLSTRVIENE